jgi:hypothetical protein
VTGLVVVDATWKRRFRSWEVQRDPPEVMRSDTEVAFNNPQMSPRADALLPSDLLGEATLGRGRSYPTEYWMPP